jgi:hypothetical protein
MIRYLLCCQSSKTRVSNNVRVTPVEGQKRRRDIKRGREREREREDRTGYDRVAQDRTGQDSTDQNEAKGREDRKGQGMF